MSTKEFLSWIFAKLIVSKNKKWKYSAVKTQEKLMFNLIKKAQKTSFGKDHNFSKITNYSDFKNAVPIRNYENLKQYIKHVVKGEKNVLWPGKPLYLSITSGTTSGKKYIPISHESLPFQIKAARDAILSYIAETGNTKIVDGKMIFLQGSPELKKKNGIMYGRLSGIVAHHIPSYLKKNRLPSFETNCIGDWDKKVDAIIEETISEEMSVISGIPPWVKMYFEKLKDKIGLLIKDLFPKFKLFI